MFLYKIKKRLTPIMLNKKSLFTFIFIIAFLEMNTVGFCLNKQNPSYPLYKNKPIRQTPDSIGSQFSNYMSSFFPIYVRNNMYNLKDWSLPFYFARTTAPFYLLTDNYGYQKDLEQPTTNKTTTYYWEPNKPNSKNTYQKALIPINKQVDQTEILKQLEIKQNGSIQNYYDAR
jgi:hypothetical protein